MSFPRYPAYKESGVEWLGEVPAAWQLVPFWTLFRRTKRTGYEGEQLLSVYRDHGVVPKSSRDDNNNKPSDDLSPYQLVEPGDLAINKMKAWQGSVAISEHRGIVSPAYFVYSATHAHHSRYLHYLFRSPRYITGYLSLSKGIRVNQWDLEPEDHSRMPVVIPSPAEQAAIASFLDHETAKIDALVAEQERLIELLKEKRQAVISHAVTKGLDSSVPMKDSGVEWLGEVPAHWEIRSLRYVLEAIGDVDHFMPASVENGVPYLMTGDLKELLSDVDLDDCKQVQHSDYLELSRKIKTARGDVVMARYATIGTLMYVDMDIDFLVSYSCVTLKTNKAILSGMHLFHYMKSDAFRQNVEHKVNTNTQGNVGIKDLQSVKIAVPPIDEQDIIVAFLNSEAEKFNSLQAESERAITLLQEHRTALISAAVTGQIDVRGLAHTQGHGA